MLRILFAASLCFALSGCEKTVSFKLKDSGPRLVVDATIENGQPPMVILTNSLDYFSQVSPGILAKSFVRGADVTLSDGQRSQQLKEYSFAVIPGISVFYYTIDSSNLGAAFKGSLNTTYSLQVKVGNTTYHATTTIPALTKTIDSLWWKKSPGNPDTTLGSLFGRITDPPGYGNYIRYFTRIGNAPFYPGLNSVFDDQIIDGTSYDIEIEKGVDRNAKLDEENYSFFKRGDTVTVKFCNIDKATFDFWRTMEYSYSSIGSPFSTPTKVLGNIDGSALGYFGGYAVQYKTLVIPK